ncbi:hypothetical protein I0292_26525 (plasmid) [Priestia megaterium]|uniref:hypothetical protein n=1 Tax=Priestia megaterium TaxID=1404 RepID=UPI00204AE088|nr:hypothetical protein [Priestia megaterium]UOO43806.1 hypothetical protein I0292_26525 [Priestia megaterium]
MNNLFRKTNEKVKDMLNDEISFLNNVKEKLVDKGIYVPITADMLRLILQKQVNKNDKIYNLEVEIQEGCIRVNGIVKKLLLKIPFALYLEPVKSEKRVLYFEIKQMRPLNQDWIKIKVLNKPPYLTYTKGSMTLDLNQVKRVNSIPVGTIQSFKMENNKLLVKIGI